MALGIGRRLLEHGLRYCRAAGVRHVRVVSDPNAEGFYVGMGAVRRGWVDSSPAPRRLPLLEISLD